MIGLENNQGLMIQDCRAKFYLPDGSTLLLDSASVEIVMEIETWCHTSGFPEQAEMIIPISSCLRFSGKAEVGTLRKDLKKIVERLPRKVKMGG